jgi:hypothetical protein
MLLSCGSALTCTFAEIANALAKTAASTLSCASVRECPSVSGYQLVEEGRLTLASFVPLVGGERFADE